MSKAEQKKRIAVLLDRMKAEARPFPDTSKEASRSRREAALADLALFCQTYLPHYFSTPLAAFHRELAALVDVRGTPVACGAPRGHGKTTLMKAKILRDLLARARRFVVVISATDDQAEEITDALRLELEENDRIRCDFGDVSDRGGKCWAAGHFVTKSGVMVLARGRGQGFRGISNGPHRPDLVVLDDLEDDEQAANPQRVAKVLKYVTGTVMPALTRGRTWSLLWVGTILDRRSALRQILDEGGEVGRAWIKRLFQARQPDGSVLCPELHSAEDLAAMEFAIGSIAFNREFQNDPIDPNGLFRAEWLTTYRPEAVPELARGLTVGFIDPSLRASHLHDFKAILIGTRHPESGCIYVRDAWIRHASIDAMVAAAYQLHDRWGCVRLGLEAVAFQELLLRDFDHAARPENFGFHLPIQPIHQGLNKELRIASISPLNERSRILYPEGWPGDLAILKEQKLAFPSRTVHDDGPDAEEGMVRLLEHTAQAVGYTPVTARRSVYGGRGGAAAGADDDDRASAPGRVGRW